MAIVEFKMISFLEEARSRVTEQFMLDVVSDPTPVPQTRTDNTPTPQAPPSTYNNLTQGGADGYRI